MQLFAGYLGVTSAQCFSFSQELLPLLHFDKHHATPCLSFILAAFVASMIVALAVLSGMSTTPQIAIGSSVLFLIPGVPMINSTLDLLTGYPLMSFSRLVRSGMLVSCIGLGLGCTLFITNLEMGSLTPAFPITNLWPDLVFDGIFAAVGSIQPRPFSCFLQWTFGSLGT